jgi:excinuclease UvrABC nuclease subunit
VEALEELRKALDLEIRPFRIEGFDIPPLGNEHGVLPGVLLQRVPDKKELPAFRIRSLEGRIDDFGAPGRLWAGAMRACSTKSGNCRT